MGWWWCHGEFAILEVGSGAYGAEVGCVDDPTAALRGLDPGRRQFAAADTAVHAARYPQIVAVTRLLLTTDWHEAAHGQWDRPEYVLRDLWRTAAPNPFLQRQRQYRQDAMPIEILLDDPYRSERAA